MHCAVMQVLAGPGRLIFNIQWESPQVCSHRVQSPQVCSQYASINIWPEARNGWAVQVPARGQLWHANSYQGPPPLDRGLHRAIL